MLTPTFVAWLMLLSISLLGVSIIVRWHFAASWGGRLYVFLVLPVAWWAFTLILFLLDISVLRNSDLMRLVGLLSTLTFILLFAFINFVVAWEERRMRNVILHLGIAPKG